MLSWCRLHSNVDSVFLPIPVWCSQFFQVFSLVCCLHTLRTDLPHVDTDMAPSSSKSFSRPRKSHHTGSDGCVCPDVVTLGTATVERRALLGVVQVAARGAAHPANATKDEQFARGESDEKLEAK